MAINSDLLDYVAVGGLLGADAPLLRIPDFQRAYSWTPRTAGQLFTDVNDARIRRPAQSYVMGSVILLKRQTDEHFEVIDGQQRLLTIHLLRSLLQGDSDSPLQSGNTPIHLVYQELARRMTDLEKASGEEGVSKFRGFLETQCQVLRIVTDDEDEAFQFFDSQNFRGKALRPHDLLKAYHLREMADSSTSEQRAVVEQWEIAGENDLDQLFGTYLARIHWWSRNVSAHAFTADDIDVFKGAGVSTRRLPGAQYHRAAKAFLPGLREWFGQISGEPDQRNLSRTQHQIDAPVAAGKAFFDYATFMLKESERLDEEMFNEDLKEYRNSPRYRFCRELYVAAAMYYTNKYGEDDWSRVKPLLIRWAYGLRLAYERLGWQSTDNYARGESDRVDGSTFNLFSSIRDNLDPKTVPLEDIRPPNEPRSANESDIRLSALLKERF
ncbi:DUF262 domain-containing protein [Brevibacterium aurantiacum]|uniref:DUF262 domain-containing protein n=1 Tax=Brevibacterium aurantiacum TaxID=273384 RepID=UPI00186679A6|nr:DUF262 domain-containing protein [Brevibacterium aurantiacum]